MDRRTQMQAARRRAREARTPWEQERQERERRIEDAAVKVLVALDTVDECERAAGAALSAMVDGEGLSLREAVTWCGPALTVRAASRLRALAGSGSAGTTDAKDGAAAAVVTGGRDVR